jgi:hypothetical protein
MRILTIVGTLALLGPWVAPARAQHAEIDREVERDFVLLATLLL